MTAEADRAEGLEVEAGEGFRRPRKKIGGSPHFPPTHAQSTHPLQKSTPQRDAAPEIGKLAERARGCGAAAEALATVSERMAHPAVYDLSYLPRQESLAVRFFVWEKRTTRHLLYALAATAIPNKKATVARPKAVNNSCFLPKRW